MAVSVVFRIFTRKLKTNSGLSVAPVMVLTSIESTFIPVKFRVATKVPTLRASRMNMAFKVQTPTQVISQLTAPASVLNVSSSGWP